MQKYLKRTLFCLIFISGFWVCWNAQAACKGSSPELTAASAHYADVKDCIDAATYGDTVNIPAGTGTGYTTATQLTPSFRYIIRITKNIRIAGAGSDSTFLDIDAVTAGDGDTIAVFAFDPDATAIANTDQLSDPGMFEVTGITFTGKKESYVNPVGVTPALKKIVRKIRIHHNRFMYFSQVISGEIGYSHGLVDNNYLLHTAAYYMGASEYSLDNLVRPGDGKGWYFEDNILELVSPSIRRSSDNSAIQTSAFKYWLNHTLYTKADTSRIAFPPGTIPQNTYGIYRVSIDASGIIIITPGVNNFTTGYPSSSAAIADLPSVPANNADMGYFHITDTAGDFVSGTTLLNASGVTFYTVTFPGTGQGFGGANNSGAAFVIRYNKLFGTATYSSAVTAFQYFDAHSNQMSGIQGGQLTEIYGNNLTAVTYHGTINNLTDLRGQKNMVLYNQLPNTASTIGVREEYNDHFSYGSSNPDPASEAARAFVTSKNLCPSRTVYNGAKQSCPGYLIGFPDSCNCWKAHDSYFFNNRRAVSGTLQAAVKTMDLFDHSGPDAANDPPEVEENVEFFNYVDQGSFDGRAGVTCGTYAQMNTVKPTTAGVGFWVPDDITAMPCDSVSPDNIKQTEGVNPAVPISGTLYKWTGFAWAAFWSPYTYPHPLRTQAHDTITPAAPGGLRVN